VLVAVVAVPSVAVAPRPLGCCRVSRASLVSPSKKGGARAADRALRVSRPGSCIYFIGDIAPHIARIPPKYTGYPRRTSNTEDKAKEGHRRQRTNKSRTSAVDRRSFVTTTVPGHRESRRNHRTMATNVTWHHTMSREQRERHLGQRGVTVSFEFSVATVCACG